MPRADWSDTGRQDLFEIGRYIGHAQKRPSVATKIMREIHDHCDALARAAYSGTSRPDLGEDVRVTSWKRWVIIFRQAAHGVDVLRIVDGSRDWSKLF